MLDRIRTSIVTPTSSATVVEQPTAKAAQADTDGFVPSKSRIQRAADAVSDMTAKTLELAKKPDAWMVGSYVAIAGGLAATGVGGVGVLATGALAWLGYQTADALSYVVHCYLDQADPAKHPAAMRTVINDFQHHHEKPGDIRDASFLYNARFVAVPLIPVSLGIAALGPAAPVAAVWSGVMMGAILTQEMHKYSHTPDKALPPMKRFVMTKVMRPLKLAIGHKAHGLHHQSPRNDNYCVGTGVNNWWMDKLGVGDAIIEVMRRFDKLYDGGTPRWVLEEQERQARAEQRAARRAAPEA